MLFEVALCQAVRISEDRPRSERMSDLPQSRYSTAGLSGYVLPITATIMF